ncbi:mercuric reductase [Gloeomargarita lithophora Alchichica-D10]|uniref:Mercuric reductase n=1 Tax=Gloeomargarita lithophora Alchichica-D10 TaxID=1188229 RepID=A0A1J0AD99_9CYAN|nr:FAD-dependent oxidoreductase [Gloeomargarita lithophora]APB33914.1 mercuric reductase [Gloeomargarita lithophora Alchichica-D10]
MAVAYNVIILGGHLEARWAALWATQQGARVALVVNENGNGTADWGMVAVALWARVAEMALQAQQSAWLFMGESGLNPVWERAASWVEQMIFAYQAQYSDSFLLQSGVDVIPGPGAFVTQPNLAVQTPERTLRACGYVVAGTGVPVLPEVLHLRDVNFLSVAQISTLSQHPRRVAILGNTPAAVVLAQAWARLGVPVFLPVAEHRLLPGEEGLLARRLERILSSEGVQIATETALKAVELRSTGIHLDCQTGTHEVDTLLVATPNHLPPETLGTLELRRQGHYLRVNRYLQTSHPRIYAVGDAVGHYPVPAVLGYELQIAVHNILYRRRKPVYRDLSWVIPTAPVLLRQGWTEAQARQHQPGLQVQTQPLSKRIGNRRGRTLGWHSLAPQAIYRHYSQVSGAALSWDSWRWVLEETVLPPIPKTGFWRELRLTWQRDGTD